MNEFGGFMLEGSCHCGNVKWTYSLPLESVTACNCTLCRRYGALWAYAHLHHGIEFSGTTKAYERGNKHNGFNFCTNCGGIAFYLANKL
ncbi:MAG: GFA family protein, partial [Pseudobdellovibrio sp.]